MTKVDQEAKCWEEKAKAELKAFELLLELYKAQLELRSLEFMAYDILKDTTND